MATKQEQKNPSIFYDRIFTHFLTILIFITPPDGLSQDRGLVILKKMCWKIFQPIEIKRFSVSSD